MPGRNDRKAMQKITGDVSPSWTGVSGWFRALVLACASFACARHPAVAPVTAQTLTPPDGATAAKAPSPTEVALYNETIRPVLHPRGDLDVAVPIVVRGLWNAIPRGVSA